MNEEPLEVLVATDYGDGTFRCPGCGMILFEDELEGHCHDRRWRYPTYAITIVTERRFRKPLFETSVGVWESVEEIKKVLARVRPKARLLQVYPLMPREASQ